MADFQFSLVENLRNAQLLWYFPGLVNRFVDVVVGISLEIVKGLLGGKVIQFEVVMNKVLIS